jgi:hypothetical protein
MQSIADERREREESVMEEMRDERREKAWGLLFLGLIRSWDSREMRGRDKELCVERFGLVFFYFIFFLFTWVYSSAYTHHD